MAVFTLLAGAVIVIGAALISALIVLVILGAWIGLLMGAERAATAAVGAVRSAAATVAQRRPAAARPVPSEVIPARAPEGSGTEMSARDD
jgi:hypothetical protein